MSEQARRNNRGFEITGVLIAKADHFLQALEGPKEVVEDTFLRIINDERHQNLLLLSRRVTTRREFGRWDMALCDEPAQIAKVIQKVVKLTAGAPSPGQKAFSDFLNAPA